VEFKTLLAVGVLISSVFLGAGYAAAEGAAVSEPHPLVGASIDAIGRSGRDVQALLADGAYYIPVGESFGFGLHLSAGLGLDEGDAKGAVAGGGTFFWRDPDSGYLGVEASGMTFLAALTAGVLVQSVVGISTTGTSVALEASRAVTARTEESSESTPDGINRNGFDLE
jgi:hypothetical protein